MAKKLLAIAMILVVAGFAFGQGKSAAAKGKKDAKSGGLTIDSLTPPGTLLADVGIGYGGLSGGAELMFAQVKIADLFPLTFGAAARAFVDPGFFYAYYSSLSFGAGGFATAHLGFKDFKFPSGLVWLNNVDSYLGLGLGFAGGVASSTWGTGYSLKPGIGISTFEGVTYYLTDAIGLTAEYGYIGSVRYDYYGTSYASWPLYYSTFGVTLKL